MRLTIPKDYFNNPIPPEVYLCTTSGKVMGVLPAYELSGTFKWSTYSEVTFSVDKYYTDVLTGETKVHPLFKKIEGPRLVKLGNIGLFVLQDLDDTYTDKDIKNATAFSIEYDVGTKYLENFRINTGDVDSKEVIYAEKYLITYDPNNPYKAASGDFDPYKRYYEQTYTDNDSYIYEETQVSDEADYLARKDTLFVRSYDNVQFFNDTNHELSLLHLIFDKIPEWTIGDVESSLWHKERKFDQDRISVYDFLTNEIVDTFKCVVEWDTLERKVNFYEQSDDGITEDGVVQDRFRTDVYITRENLANEIHVKYSTDNIKTKLKVTGAEDFDISEVNLGKNYIINLDYYKTDDWMDQELKEAYQDYLDATTTYSPQYTTAMQNWVATYNKWNDLMNAVPAEASVVLVGDEFKKLYCVYEPIDNAYLKDITLSDSHINQKFDDLYTNKTFTTKVAKDTLIDNETFIVQGYRFIYIKSEQKFKCIDTMLTYNINKLTGGDEPKKGKLAMYRVNEDLDATNTDNVLLKLKNNNSDIATLRIYNSGTKESPIYSIQKIVVMASEGTPQAAVTYTMTQWLSGGLTADTMDLTGFKVTYIGTMGAYFVLAKDETQESTLEEYGVNLLKEKHDTYTTIFQTQTEGMLSNEKYQCIVQDDTPTGTYDIGTKWLDTNSSPMKLKEYTNAGWVDSSIAMTEDDQRKYEDYQRYIDNYEKLAAVQRMLLRKEQQAGFYLDGYAVTSVPINPNNITSDAPFKQAASTYFGNATITRMGFDETLNIYTFLSSFDPGRFIRDTGPYSATTQYYKKVIQIYDKATGSLPTNTTTETIDVETYQLVHINSKDIYDTYDGSTADKTLYIQQSGHIFAVYLKGTTPYVSYFDSQGIYQTQMNYIKQETEFEKFFTKEQWITLSPLIREDEFMDDNFLLTGYESEEERLRISNELMEAATKELKTLSQPSLEFSMTMANILALPEFTPIISQFALGNFIRIELEPGIVKKSRLLEAQINFSDLSSFDVTFGNLVTTKSEIDLHAELLSQAISAGKQVAAAAGEWQAAVDRSNKLEEAISNGLKDAALSVGSASGQAISWDSQGIRCRKYKDGSTSEFDDVQIAIINNKLVFTNDNWRTSKAAFGEFTIEGRDTPMYGLLADAVVGGYIKGATIEGGHLEIGGEGGKFIVSEDGSVQILSAAGDNIYATAGDVHILSQALKYQTELTYENSTIFADINADCIITCKVYRLKDDLAEGDAQEYEDITSQLEGKATFNWIRNPSPWTATDKNKKAADGTNLAFNKIRITHEDVDKNAQFTCQVQFDDANLTNT